MLMLKNVFDSSQDKKFGDAGNLVVVEEKLSGEEISVRISKLIIMNIENIVTMNIDMI